MKRHPAFQDLSRDHYVALNRSLQVVRAVEGHPSARPYEEVAFQFLDLWLHDGLQAHFREEETDLVPVLAERGATELVTRMLREHEALRTAFGQLEAGQLDRAGTAQAARDLTAHVRWEEESVFEWLQVHLAEAELVGLLRTSQAFRQANGLPVNPPQP